MQNITFYKSPSHMMVMNRHSVSTITEMAEVLEVSNPPKFDPNATKTEMKTNLHLFDTIDTSMVTFESLEQLTKKNKNGDDYTAYQATIGDAVIPYWSRGGLMYPGRCNDIVKQTSIIKIDIDEQKTSDIYDRVKKYLDDAGLGYIMYTSKSNGTVKECKVYNDEGVVVKRKSINENGNTVTTTVTAPRMAYSFRVLLFLTTPIVRENNVEQFTDYMTAIYNHFSREFDLLGKTGEDVIDPASKVASQFMVGPMCSDKCSYCYDIHEGLHIDPAIFAVEMAKLDSQRKLAAAIAEKKKADYKEKKERKKNHPEKFRKRLDFVPFKSSKIIDIDGFVDAVNSDPSTPLKMIEVSSDTDSRIFRSVCPSCYAYDGNHNPRMLQVTQTYNGTIYTKCFSVSCPYHSDASNFVNDFRTYIPDAEDIDDYVEKTDIADKEHPDFLKLIGKVHDAVPPITKKCKTILNAAPGLGKSHNSAMTIHEFLADTEMIPIHSIPLLLIVVPNKRLQQDLDNTYQSMYGVSLRSEEGVTILRSGKTISKKARVIVTVQTYLQKMGHTTEDYKLIKFLKQDWPIPDSDETVKRRILLIIDEADSFIDGLHTSIEVGFRTKTVTDTTLLSSEQSFEVKHSRCPTERYKSFQCDRCMYSNELEIFRNEAGLRERKPCATNREYRDMKRKHDEMCYFIKKNDSEVVPHASQPRIDIDAHHGFSIAYDNKSHVCYSFIPKFKRTFGDEVSTSYMEWVAEKTYQPEIIRLNTSEKCQQYYDDYMSFFNGLGPKEFSSDSEDVDDDDDGARGKWYERYEKKLSAIFLASAQSEEADFSAAYEWMLPWHPCSSTHLRYYDTDIIKQVAEMSDYILVMSGTYNDHQLKILEHILGDGIDKVSVVPEIETKPIDKLLVIATTAELPIGDKLTLNSALRNYVNEASPNKTYGDEIGYHLHVDTSKNAYYDIKKDDANHEFTGYLEGIGVTIPDGVGCYRPSFIRTYAGSPYTRGANLGQFHSITYDFFGSYDLPMFALNTYYGDDVGVLRESAKVTGMLQALFRIMRKKKDPETHEVTSHPCGEERRVMVVGNCVNVVVNPKSRNTIYNFSNDVINLIADKAKDVTKNDIDTIIYDEKKYLNTDRLSKSIFATRTHYLRTGEVKIYEESFDESILYSNGKMDQAKRLIKLYPNLLSITGMSFEELEETRKFVQKLNKLIKSQSHTGMWRFKQAYSNFEVKIPLSPKLSEALKKILSDI